LKCLAVVAVLALLGALGALATVHLGLPDVAATRPHWEITEWALSTTMENSVRRRAAGIETPPDLDDPARIRAGASARSADAETERDHTRDTFHRPFVRRDDFEAVPRGGVAESG